MPNSSSLDRTDASTLELYDKTDAPSAVSWAAILGGSFTAVALMFILLALGAGFGIASLSPGWGEKSLPSHFSYIACIWLILTQWLSSALGGYITGRLRTQWIGVHTHEVFFRDTAHGLLTWAVATVFYTALIVCGASSASHSLHRMDFPGQEQSAGVPPLDASYIDDLFRTDRPGATLDPDTRREATHILWKGAEEGSLSETDEAYLAQLVGAHAGIASADAKSKVDETIVRLRQSATAVRKTAATVSIFTSLSMLIGAFIACIASALGGLQRDEPHPAQP